jgi:F420-0:gamma-glutamyl ligase
MYLIRNLSSVSLALMGNRNNGVHLPLAVVTGVDVAGDDTATGKASSSQEGRQVVWLVQRMTM